jgi:hypothetical protein
MTCIKPIRTPTAAIPWRCPAGTNGTGWKNFQKDTPCSLLPWTAVPLALIQLRTGRLSANLIFWSYWYVTGNHQDEKTLTVTASPSATRSAPASHVLAAALAVRMLPISSNPHPHTNYGAKAQCTISDHLLNSWRKMASWSG